MLNPPLYFWKWSKGSTLIVLSGWLMATDTLSASTIDIILLIVNATAKSKKMKLGFIQTSKSCIGQDKPLLFTLDHQIQNCTLALITIWQGNPKTDDTPMRSLRLYTIITIDYLKLLTLIISIRSALHCFLKREG